jgi:hypothetical protein
LHLDFLLILVYNIHIRISLEKILSCLKIKGEVMSGHAAPAVAPTQGASSKRGTIAGLVGGLIVLVLLAFMAQCGARAISNQKTVTQPTTTSAIRVERTLGAVLGSNYGEVVNLPSGYLMEFRATQPYCVNNAAGLEACGDKDEDVSGDMGNVRDNRKLRFKSSNGQPGRITIRLERRER